MDPYGGGYSGRNRAANNGGPSGVQRSFPSQYREHEALFSTYEHLQGLERGDAALKLLRKVASMVKPIMRKRDWKVQILAEFLPPESNLLGLNINKGYKICIRLRYHNNPDLFLPIEQIVDTLLHELSHNVFGNHDGNFHRLWDELRDEYETLLFKGFTGEGFLGRGQRLGGRSNVPPPDEMRRLARASAEQRRIQDGHHAGSGQRLGGKPLHHGQDAREVIAGQAIRRNTISRGCGSIHRDASAIDRMSNQPTFKTQAEEDDANDRAIAEALFDLMEAEESAKLNGTYRSTPANGGLAWTKEQGLFDPNNQIFDAPGNAAPTEEEQMRWAIEESKRLAPASESPQDFGGLPPESLVSPISPLTPENLNRARAPSLAARLRGNPSPISPIPQNGIARNPSAVSARSAVSGFSAVSRNSEVSRASSLSSVHPALRSNLARSASDRSESIASVANMPTVDISEPFNPDEWICEVCTCVNPVQFLACDACGSERSHSIAGRTGIPQSPLQSPQLMYSPPSHPGPMHSGPMHSRNSSSIYSQSLSPSSPNAYGSLGWNCARCGAFMEHRWWTCSACGQMKASS